MLKGPGKENLGAPPAKSTQLLSLDARKALAVQCIIDLRSSNEKFTIRDIARQFGVSHSWLGDRMRGRKTRKEARYAQQKLGPQVELVLLQWIQYWGERGIPMTTHAIRAKAMALAGQDVGLGWIYRFQRRHPEIKSVQAATIDAKRAKQVNEPVAQHFFDLLMEELFGYHIPPENIFNMDEKGIVCGQQERVKVWVDRNQKNTVMIGEKERELTTVIECVCADGSAISPMIIFKGVRQSKQWYCEADGGMNAVVAVSPNGWTDQELSLQWMVKVFEPETKKKCQNSAPRLLIIDGHNSHTHFKFLEYAQKHDIIVLCLPPHTTHRLQPCDVGVFGPLSTAWKKEVQRCFSEGKVVDKYNLIEVYSKARQASFKETTIKAAFKTTGIWPFNRDALGKEAYLPSQATTVHMNLPGPAKALHAEAIHQAPAPGPTEAPEDVPGPNTSDPSVANSTPQHSPANVPHAETHLASAPYTAQGLNILEAVCASRIPDLPLPNTDRADLWEALSDTRAAALEMAEYIETLTAWCKLYVSENAMLRNLVHGKRNRPTNHFLPGKARVLTKADQLAAIKKAEDEVIRKAAEKASRSKAKGKRRGATVPKHQVWIDEEEDPREDFSAAIGAVQDDNDDYIPDSGQQSPQTARRQRPQRGKGTALAQVELNIVPADANAEAGHHKPALRIGSVKPTSSVDGVIPPRRSTRQTTSQKKANSTQNRALQSKSDGQSLSPSTVSQPCGSDGQEETTVPAVQASRTTRRFKAPPDIVPGAPEETEDDFFIRNPVARSTTRSGRRLG